MTVNSAMGILYTGKWDGRLGDLTLNRSADAVPFAGRYRMIDFPLSAMTGSGIRNVGVILQKNYTSLMDHLGSGREWDLHGKKSRLVMLPPLMSGGGNPIQRQAYSGIYSGLLEALWYNLHYLRRSTERYTVVTDTHILHSARYDDLIEQHEKSGADITLLYSNSPSLRRNGLGVYLKVGTDGQAEDMEIEPSIPHMPATFLETFCIRRELLIKLTDDLVSKGEYSFTKDLLLRAVRDRSVKIFCAEYKGMAWAIDSIQAYFKCSMDMLSDEKRDSLFPADRPVLTKLRDEMPSSYRPGSRVVNSLIADGCVIEGEVENCVLFRGVHVAPGAKVKNTVIMQDGEVLGGAEVENCIMDKQTVIRENTRLIGPKSYPTVIAKGLMI